VHSFVLLFVCVLSKCHPCADILCSCPLGYALTYFEFLLKLKTFTLTVLHLLWCNSSYTQMPRAVSVIFGMFLTTGTTCCHGGKHLHVFWLFCVFFAPAIEACASRTDGRARPVMWPIRQVSGTSDHMSFVLCGL